MIYRLVPSRAAFVVTVVTCVAAMTGKVAADEFFIADGDVAGLINAINDANAQPGKSAVIHLAENGTYTLMEVNNSFGAFGPNGLPVIGTEMTINANGSTIERSSEPGTPDFRIVIVLGPSSGFDGKLTLNDATITGGQTSNGAAGIALSGTVTVVNCTISNNTSGLNGGGIGNSTDGVLTVIDSTITGNWASNNGGGIRNFADAISATVINSTITGNGTSGNGGGIDSRALMSVTNSIIADNSAGSFGGGIANESMLTLTESTLSGNSAMFGNGGGLWSHHLAPAQIGDSVLCDNSPNQISGPFVDLGGNVFSNECPTDPSEFFIADGDVAGLIAAINAANAETDKPAVIHLAENGTYTLTEVDNFDFGFGPNGLPTIITEITINGKGATIERSSMPGTPDFRIMLVIGPVEGVDGILTLNDATITGAQTPNGAAGIATSGTVTVVNCTISKNSAGLSGGGIGNAFGGVLTVIDSAISDNWATVDGGGLKNFSHGDTATVINSVITGNETAGPGGGIDTRSPMTIINCTIAGNSTSDNGGGIANFSTLTLTDSTISENTAMFGNGGGLWTQQFALTEIGGTSFCDNDPDHIEGPWNDLGGNTFSDICKDCPGDLTGNGNVGVPDLLELLAQWGPCDDPRDCPADLTGNGSVGVPDLLELLSLWGPCP